VPGNGAKCYRATVLTGLLVQPEAFAQSYPQPAVRIFSPAGIAFSLVVVDKSPVMSESVKSVRVGKADRFFRQSFSDHQSAPPFTSAVTARVRTRVSSPFSTNEAPTCSSAAIRTTRCRPSPRSGSAQSARNPAGPRRAAGVAAACDPRPSSTASHSNRRAR